MRHRDKQRGVDGVAAAVLELQAGVEDVGVLIERGAAVSTVAARGKAPPPVMSNVPVRVIPSRNPPWPANRVPSGATTTLPPRIVPSISCHMPVEESTVRVLAVLLRVPPTVTKPPGARNV